VIVAAPDHTIHVLDLQNPSMSSKYDSWAIEGERFDFVDPLKFLIELRHGSDGKIPALRLRPHKTNSSIWYAYKDDRKSPLWCFNTISRDYFSVNVKDVFDIDSGNGNDLVIATCNGIEIYETEAMRLKSKLSFLVPGDERISTIRTPPASTRNPGVDNLLAYTLLAPEEHFDMMVQFIDLRCAQNVVTTLDYRDHKKFIRSCTTSLGTRMRPPHYVMNMSFSPDGNFFETCGADNCVFVHDLRNPSKYFELHSIFEHELSSITRENVTDDEYPYDGVAAEWSSDSRFIISGADDCHVRVWDIQESSRNSVRSIKWDTSEGRTHALSRSANDDMVAVGTSKGYLSIFGV
jgi:WD40 repeat protein